MLSKADTLFSKSLVEKGMMNAAALQPILDEAAKSKEGLLQLLLKKGGFSEDELLANLSECLKIPFVELYQLMPEPAALEKVPLKIAEYYKFVPLRLERKKLTAAVSAPMDLRTQDDIRAHLGLEVEMVLARQKDVTEALKKAYGFAAGAIGEMLERQAPLAESSQPSLEKIEAIDQVEKLAGDASIAKLVNQIIVEAFHKRATDIHLEPYRGKVKLRYRIDGELYNANVPAEISQLILPILSRVKIMSNLNIVEKRLPQDGRAIVKVEDVQLDLRVSSIPTPYGESIVIRMLPMNRVFDLGRLGLNPKQLQSFESLINKPHGILFITGPTGSGKSTTLYACLNKINTEDRKIITIEDPVEYEMEGVTQIQVASNIGLDFARGLRSMLRHDPDVMMVGEVRDLETAEMAIRVALTGHLVFSTLHTNDAASGITRLVDIGIAPYLVASSVEAFIAQRLIRLICKNCREENKAFPQEMKERIARELRIPSKNAEIYHGKGCNQCNFTGYWGRLAIYEILLVNEKIKSLIMHKAASGDVKREAMRQGMRTLRQDGWQKVIEGLTTPGEVLDATPPDDEAEHSEMNVEQIFTPAVRIQDVPSKAQSDAGADRRLFPRLSANVKVNYRIVKNSKQPSEISDIAEGKPDTPAGTRNISAGGLALLIKESVGAGSILELQVELPTHPESLHCLAKVVRCRSVEGTPYFDAGVCFLDLSATDRQLLEKFVDKEKKQT